MWERFRLKRFDQIALGMLCGLTCLIVLIWGLGDRTPTQVQSFSWDGRQIGVQDEGFSLSLNQAIDPALVIDNFTIDPPLQGQWSWVGKQFFYRLSEVPLYGQDYQLNWQLTDAEPVQRPLPFEPFLGRVNSRDRAFVYIATEGAQRGRLILSNLTREEETILTPADLIVLNFDVYPDGDRLLLSAIRRSANREDLGDQQLYTVSTGLNFQGADGDAAIAGRMNTVLESTDYRNGSFQLSGDGNRIIIDRVSRADERDHSLWVIEGENHDARALGIPADDFLLAPDGDLVAVSQENRLSLVPLNQNGGAIQAREEFSQVLAFSPNQSQQIALQKADSIYRLFLLEPDGKSREITRTLTPILDCRFEPRAAELLYCLKIDRNETSGEIVEEPFLSAININTGEETPLLALPNYQDVELSVAADGVALLFDQIVTRPATPTSDLFTETGLAVEGGRLWLLLLPELINDGETELQPVPPESLVAGFQPKWIP